MREPPVSRFISRATPQASGGAPAEPREAAPRPREGGAAAAPQGPSPARAALDSALFGLSEPALPRDASPAETASFVPPSHQSTQAAHVEPAPVLDDFDRLVANEMAAREPRASAGAAEPAGPAFTDYDIRFHPQAAEPDDEATAYEDAGGPVAYEPEVTTRPSSRRVPPPAVRQGGGMRRGVTFVSSVAGVALISIAVAVTWNSLFGAGGSSEPLLIAADTQPYKTKPEDPGGREIPNQNKAVYQRATGQAAPATAQETLIATEEEPVDISAEDAFDLPGVSIGREDIRAGEESLASGENVASEEDMAGGENLGARMAALSQEAAAGASPSGVLEPRRVRTVEVRPDGTIVGAPAGEVAAAPQAMTAAPAAAPTADSAADPMAALIASATAERDALSSGQVSMPASLPVGMPAGTPAAPPPVAEAAPPPVSIVPTPAPARPRPAAAAPAVAALAPAPAPARAPAQAAPAAGGYFVQLSAQPNEALARQALRDASLRYANILSGSRLSIQTADVENRGTFYRVRAQAPSQAEAERVCGRLQRAGAECFVTR